MTKTIGNIEAITLNFLPTLEEVLGLVEFGNKESEYFEETNTHLTKLKLNKPLVVKGVAMTHLCMWKEETNTFELASYNEEGDLYTSEEIESANEIDIAAIESFDKTGNDFSYVIKGN